MPNPKNDQNSVGGNLESILKYPEHLKLIGLIVTDGSGLEGRLALLFWALLRAPAHASTIFYTLGSGSARIDIIRAMADGFLPDKIKEETLAALEDARNASSRRNDIVHAQWGTPAQGGPDPFWSLERPGTKKKIQQRICTLAYLQDIIAAIAAADRRIGSITMVINAQHDDSYRIRLKELRGQFPSLDTYLKRFE